MAEEKNNGWKMTFRPVIASLIILGSFGTWYLVFRGYCPTEWEKLAFMIVGAEIALLTQIVGWYFGSSEDSSKKTDLLSERRAA
jgi:hypothetical protein